MHDEILRLLHERGSAETDQGLLVDQLAREIQAHPDDVTAALGDLAQRGLAHEESPYWYQGPAPDPGADGDQS